MHVRFYESGMGVECVAIRTGFDGKDEVHRVATEEDKKHFAVEYAAFRLPPVVVPPVVTAPPMPAKPVKKH